MLQCYFVVGISSLLSVLHMGNESMPMTAVFLFKCYFVSVLAQLSNVLFTAGCSSPCRTVEDFEDWTN